MLEPFQQITWSRLDRRAWGLSLSVLVLYLLFAVIASWSGKSWTYRTGLEYVPKEIRVKAYEIGSDLMELPLTLPNYAFGEIFVLENIAPQDWLYPVFLAVFLLIISFLAAGVTCFYGTWFYGCLTGLGLGAALFGAEVFAPAGITEKWISALGVLLVCVPVYVINNWFSGWNLARRWWVLLLVYLIPSFFLLHPASPAVMSLASAQLWPVLLLGSLAFIVFNSCDVLQGVLTLVTRDDAGRQSWLHFTIFSLLYLSNFILIYLRNSGKLVLDILYPNPFWIQYFTLILGFWMLARKQEFAEDDGSRNMGLSVVYVGLASLFLLTCAMAHGLANDLMTEVLEDAITLIHFCMGLAFFLYVVINFFPLMMVGLKIYQVMFRPRYMPLYSIPVFGLGGVWLFLVNDGYFPYSQSIAARQVMLADHAVASGDYFLAENYLQNALSFDFRNQRANLSLSDLYLRMGNPAKAKEYAEASLDKKPSTEAHLAIARIYRQKKQNLQEILQLQAALRAFPQEGKLQNNLGMAFMETVFRDSAQYYLSKAAESTGAGREGNANLGYYYLVNRLETEGLPQKSPERQSKGDWAAINNSVVFANVAHEKSPDLAEIQSSFTEIPESVQPFLLFHAYINKAITRDSSDFQKWKKLENDTIRRYYSDPIDLSRAMLIYRTGRVKEGVQQLLGLLESSSENRRDLSLLLGQIFFEQGAYASAASFFRQASFMQVKKANYWYALSCLDAGRQADAAAAFSEVLSELGPADKIRITVLADGLKSGKFHNAAQRSDPEKSAFIKVQWNTLSNQQIIDLIYLISDKESQRFLWKYAFDRAYNESMASRCKALFGFARSQFGKKEKWIRQIQEAKGKYLEITGQVNALSDWTKANGSPEDFPFFRAQLALAKNDSAAASAYFLKALEVNPFSLRQTGVAIGYLSSVRESRPFAYQKSLEISNLDPSNVEYQKLYAWFCIKEGLPEFAYAMIPKIAELTNTRVANEFKKKLDEELAKKNFPAVPLP